MPILHALLPAVQIIIPLLVKTLQILSPDVGSRMPIVAVAISSNAPQRPPCRARVVTSCSSSCLVFEEMSISTRSLHSEPIPHSFRFSCPFSVAMGIPSEVSSLDYRMRIPRQQIHVHCASSNLRLMPLLVGLLPPSCATSFTLRIILCDLDSGKEPRLWKKTKRSTRIRSKRVR